MPCSYTQFCLQQMGISTWHLHCDRYASLVNASNQVVGQLILGCEDDPLLEEATVFDLIAAMLQAISLRASPLQRCAPDGGKLPLVLIMGSEKSSIDWNSRAQSVFCIAHPWQFIKQPALKRDAWTVLKQIKELVK